MNKTIKTSKKNAKNEASPMASAIEQGALVPDSSRDLPLSAEPGALAASLSEEATGADLPTEAATIEEPAANEVVVDPAEAEKAYGQQRLADLLNDRDAFLAECRAGLEPAVAEALFAKAHHTGVYRPSGKGSSIPYLAKSTCDSPVAKVWELAAAMKGLPRKEVITACVLAGVATSTAHTQYQSFLAAGKKSVLVK